MRAFLLIMALINLVLGLLVGGIVGCSFLVLAVYWTNEANHMELMEKLDERTLP